MPDIGGAIGAVGSIAGGLIGGSNSSDAATESANAQVKAAEAAADAQRYAALLQAGTAEDALALQKKMWRVGRHDLAPWRIQGGGAVNEIGMLMGIGSSDKQAYGNKKTGMLTNEDLQQAAMDRFYTSPGYEFRLDEGINAIDRSAAARGGLFSGATAKESQAYGEGLAANEFSDYYNRLAGIAGSGQTAVQSGVQSGTQMANQGSNTLANLSNAYGNLGQGLSNSAYNIGNAQSSGIINSANAWNSAIPNIYGGISKLGNLFGNSNQSYNSWAPSSNLWNTSNYVPSMFG